MKVPHIEVERDMEKNVTDSAKQFLEKYSMSYSKEDLFSGLFADMRSQSETYRHDLEQRLSSSVPP
jgi:hypothetical protein